MKHFGGAASIDLSFSRLPLRELAVILGEQETDARTSLSSRYNSTVIDSYVPRMFDKRASSLFKETLALPLSTREEMITQH